jgi:hypothetical protein
MLGIEAAIAAAKLPSRYFPRQLMIKPTSCGLLIYSEVL